jgi:hypothetical protein
MTAKKRHATDDPEKKSQKKFDILEHILDRRHGKQSKCCLQKKS